MLHVAYSAPDRVSSSKELKDDMPCNVSICACHEDPSLDDGIVVGIFSCHDRLDTEIIDTRRRGKERLVSKFYGLWEFSTQEWKWQVQM